MRASLASLLSNSRLSVEDWLQRPLGGQWPTNLSRKGIMACARPDCEKLPNRKDVRLRPGCADGKRRVLKIARGATQPARRAVVWGNSECTLSTRATRNSDEVRYPWSKSESVRATARRVVRRSPVAPKSADYWPGEKAKSRPDVPSPEGEPCGEPGEVCLSVALLQSDPPPHVRDEKWAEAFYSPPASEPHRLAGGSGSEPRYPLCVWGVSQDTLRDLYGASDASSWRGEPFRNGSCPVRLKVLRGLGCAVFVVCPVGARPCTVVPPLVACPSRSRDGSWRPKPRRRSGGCCAPNSVVCFEARSEPGRTRRTAIHVHGYDPGARDPRNWRSCGFGGSRRRFTATGRRCGHGFRHS